LVWIEGAARFQGRSIVDAVDGVIGDAFKHVAQVLRINLAYVATATVTTIGKTSRVRCRFH
jgi:hypothetical protein